LSIIGWMISTAVFEITKNAAMISTCGISS
jgi:hypothetical protein